MKKNSERLVFVVGIIGIESIKGNSLITRIIYGSLLYIQTRLPPSLSSFLPILWCSLASYRHIEPEYLSPSRMDGQIRTDNLPDKLFIPVF